MDNRDLKRTDTKAVPSPISNKYDKPQKNSRKIYWDENKNENKSLIKQLKDSELMPPPPLPKSPPPSNKRPKLSKRKDSPYPKKTIKKNNELIVKRYSKIIY